MTSIEPTSRLSDELSRRILVLDGAMGTMIQGRDTGSDFCGCNDFLAISHPEIIADIHEKYLVAGADIISTNSFNANAISLADYGLQSRAYEINRATAALAREKADEFTLRNPSKPRFVAGSMGPTNRTASLASDPDDPAAREVTFEELRAAYFDQARGLVDGGVDILLVETVFDTLNAKAALFAIAQLRDERAGLSRPLPPVMVSGTIAGAAGRTLSGQTVEAFYASVSPFLAPSAPPSGGADEFAGKLGNFFGKLLSIGLNCGFGARQMLPYLERLAATAECLVSCHPNAGLPNIAGGYDETPEAFAADCEEFMRRGLVNIVGGCCGTTPEHTRLVAQAAARHQPRPVPVPRHETVLAGLETLTSGDFVYIGERANVAGSARFARLVREGDFDGAIAAARVQVADGAHVVDVCMDDGMIDGVAAMRRFLLMAAAEPELARVPFMIDSSSWEVLEAGLQCVQGKPLANSISLKEGSGEFLRRAELVRRYGAAVVVMLFDEQGQADTFERKVFVAERAYKLLTDSGFPPEDIVFDPNVLTIATGIAAHDNYAVDFIRATRWIKQNLPHARVSAGVSNLSFAFRGNGPIREAMHAVFLHHAREAGLDMAIVNVATLLNYNDLEPSLLELIEDVVLARRPDAAERLAEFAERVKAGQSLTPAEGSARRLGGRQTDELQLKLGERSGESAKQSELSVSQQITRAMLSGDDSGIAELALEAHRESGSPLAVIDNVLMPAMAEVGRLFGEGQMFLPQVVKSARVMRRAVDALEPYIRGMKRTTGSRKKLLLATVRGDVHDIGKNIVGVVAACNGWEIVDLGVMVEATKIADMAVRNSVSVIGLSGLITPSLHEMIEVVRELRRRGVDIPVLIGGATTSPLHTAVKIAPEYDGVVIHATDAADGSRIIGELQGTDNQQFISHIKASQHTLRQKYFSAEMYRRLEPLIDWPQFFAAWKVAPDSDQARELRSDAEKMLERMRREQAIEFQEVAGVFPAHRDGDDIVVRTGAGEIRLPQLRSLSSGLSVADYVAPAAENGDSQDFIGVFALTAGVGLGEFVEKLRTAPSAGGEGDDYGAIMAKLLTDRLTEAFAEVVHERLRGEYASMGSGPVDAEAARETATRGARFAFGYPATPDHSQKREIFDMLEVEKKTAMRLTDNNMIVPGESICGMVIFNPEARFFSPGTLSDDQIADYARRRGKPLEEIKKMIVKL